MKVLTFPEKFLDPTTGETLPLPPVKALVQAVGITPFNKTVEENFTAGNLATALKDLKEDATEFVFEEAWQELMERAVLNRSYILDVSNPLLHAIRDAKAYKPKS